MIEKKKKDKKQELENEAVEKENVDLVDNAEKACTEDEKLAEAAEEVLSDTDKLSAEIESLKAQIDKQHNDYLLLMAEFDNYRKRTLREKADLLKNGGESCMKAILPVIDDVERAMQAIESSSDIEALKEGLNLIYSKFRTYLEQNGVKEMETKNVDFDPEKHEAIAQIPAASPELKGKIIDCTQKGYTLNDNVIRFPKVVVAQ